MKYIIFLIITLKLTLSFSQSQIQLSKGKDNVGNPKQSDSILITIMVPRDIGSYIDSMTDFIIYGGGAPSNEWPFIKKQIRVPYTTDIVRESAEAAAEMIPTAGGPEHASIAYFKLENKIAYVLLDIDIDGWVGVSYSISIIHPLIEKTLLQFPQIDKVIFDRYPGDN